MKKIIACLLVAFQLAPSINAVLPVIKGQELLDTEHGPGLVQAYQNKFRPPNPADRPQAIRAFKSFVKKCSLKAADRVPGLVDVNDHERAAMQAVFNMMKHRLTDGYYAGLDNHDPGDVRRHKINSALVNVSNMLLVKRFYPAGDDIVLGDSFVDYARNVRALLWEQIVEMNGLAGQTEADKRILPDLLKSYVYNVIEMNAYGLEPTDAEKQNAWTLATVIQDKYSQSKMIPLIKATLLHWGYRPDGISDEEALAQKRVLFQQYAEVEHVVPAPLQLVNFLQEHAAQEAGAEAIAQGAVDDEMAQGNNADVDGSDGEDDQEAGHEEQITAQLRDVTKTRSKEGRERGYENLAHEIQADVGAGPEDGQAQGGEQADFDADESDDEDDFDGGDGQAGAGGMETDDDGADASDEDSDNDNLPPAFGPANLDGGGGAAAATSEEDSDDEDMQPVQVRQQRALKALLTSDESDEEDDSTESAEQDVTTKAAKNITTKAKRRYVDAAAAAAAADSESDDESIKKALDGSRSSDDGESGAKKAKNFKGLFDDDCREINLSMFKKSIEAVWVKNNKKKMALNTLARKVNDHIKKNKNMFYFKPHTKFLNKKNFTKRIKNILESTPTIELAKYVKTPGQKKEEENLFIERVFTEIRRVQEITGEFIAYPVAIENINKREGENYSKRAFCSRFATMPEYVSGRNTNKTKLKNMWRIIKKICDDFREKNKRPIKPSEIKSSIEKHADLQKCINDNPFLRGSINYKKIKCYDRCYKNHEQWPHIQ